MMEHAAQSHTLSSQELDELSVRCLVLPLSSLTLLVPNTLVAEVIDYRPAESAGHMPEWMTGMLSWRGRNVPVISFERLLGDTVESPAQERRYVICNTLNNNERIPFIALEVQGIPHLTQVSNTMLDYDTEDRQSEPAVLARLRLDEESVTVPNVDVMEKMLEHLGFAAG
ncbi:MAG: chemotaxis protein CheW [Gammaproteobacteria bacterium]|nr:chemotaxis protein CheW [Gammaproteobacteria bacterium]MCW8840550.1 chemotaxis protein CheW [Gammaproteobacteria bacterium]MCW8927530.1 chemotaxis protein CheW [Gammaproteobacteria bacterium]MCW8959290.1 chemotaxis protein CheW [Gammaproteobacteria bacterium]MCW8973298.1 chemotaxis protein CheW [Gammaproteobacteria bacterium]